MKVLQTKFLNHFLYGEEIKTPDSEVLLLKDGNLPSLACELLKLLKIEQARIYLTEPSFERFSSSENLIAEVRERPLEPWKDTRVPISFDERWKCETQVPKSVRYWKEIDMHQLDLSNRMIVLLCKSQYPYKCSMKGFAYGGLSQQDEKNRPEYVSSYFAVDIVENLASHGLKYDLVGRENLSIELDVQDYIRSFESLFDKSELHVALQLVYLLFCEKPNSTPADVENALSLLRSKYKAKRSHQVYEHVSKRKLQGALRAQTFLHNLKNNELLA